MKLSEFEIQSYVSTRLKQLNILHHGDLAGIKTSPSQAARAKACGMRKGWPDMCVVLPGRVVFLEFKTINGRQSMEQRKVEKLMNECNNDSYYVVQCDTREAAWERVRGILQIS